MHEQPQIELPGEEQPDRGPFSFALLVAAAAVIIVLVGFYLWPGRQSPSLGGIQEVHPPFGPEERAYASKIAIESVALRESRLAVNSASPPFGPRARRSFDVSFEHIPTSWNMQQPAVRVTGLLFASSTQ
jgi:hypothetical protein